MVPIIKYYYWDQYMGIQINEYFYNSDTFHIDIGKNNMAMNEIMKIRIVQKPINYEHLFIKYIEREIFIQKNLDVKYYTAYQLLLTNIEISQN